MAIKWTFTSGYNFSNKKFAQIYSFFVIESPIAGVSNRGITFEDRKIDMNSLSACIKRSVPALKDSWHVTTAAKVDEELRNNEIFKSVKMPIEIAVHIKRDESNTKGLFYAIRCAFAHGSFSIHTCKGIRYYLLENKDKGKIKGRIVLKEDSLLSIIKAVDEAKIKCKNSSRKKAVAVA